jgi:acetoin utilization deacetylase AcuC-like enzyme
MRVSLSLKNHRSCFSSDPSFTIAYKAIDHNNIALHYRRSSTTIRNKASFFSSSAVLLSSSYNDSIYLPPTLTRVNEEIQAKKEEAARQQQKHGASNDDSPSIASTSNHEQQPPPPTTNICSDSIYIDNGLLAERLGLNPTTNIRHAPMVYHEQYSFPNWPNNHTFPMAKFEQTAYSLLNDVDDYLLNVGSGIGRGGDDYFVDDNHWNGLRLVVSPTHFYRPLSSKSIPTCLLSPPLDSNYVNRFLSGSLTNEECRIIGFREHTSRSELIDRTVVEVAGTVLAAQLALRYGLASNVAGGTHHAQRNQGRGFCILNDLAVVTRLMTWTDEIDSSSDGEDVNLFLRGLYRGNTGVSIERVLVVDCDVHQGDGTATFAYPNVEDSLHGKLFTLDLHAKDNYPLRKEQCTYDIGLPDECNDEMYLAELSTSLNVALTEVQPQLVLYNAGVDIYIMDKLGRLSVSTDGMELRDTHVIRTCIDNNIPIACVVGGGYDNDVAELGRRHALVHRVCAKIWRERQMWKRSIVY